MSRYHITYLVLLIFLIAVLSSCKIGKKYARPELNLPVAIENVTDSTTIDSISWGEIYTDPVLQELIQKALYNNKDMQIAAAKVKEMMATKRISFANQFPEIEGRLNAQKEELNYGGNNPVPNPELSAKAVLSWEIDLWGNLRWASEADVAAYMQSVEARQALQITIIAEVAAKYYELLALDNELSILHQTLNARREGLRLTKLRFEGGLTSETAYNQAQLELARTETLVPGIERDIRIKENDLAFLIGEYPGQLTRGAALIERQLSVSLPVGLPSSLLERRPDIRQAEQKLREANARVGVAYTNMFPRITLTGNYGVESEELGNLLKSPAWFIAGDLLQPIFAMGRNRARHKAAQARFEQEVYTYQKSVLQAFREVSDALITVQKVVEIRQSRADLEEAANKFVQLAQLQYINGITNYIDLLDAQRGLFDAQIGLNNAILNEQLSVVYLYKALGGGY